VPKQNKTKLHIFQPVFEAFWVRFTGVF